MQAFIMISHSSLDQKRSLISLAVLLAYFHLHFFMPPFAASPGSAPNEAVFINAAQWQVAGLPPSCSSGSLQHLFARPCLLLGHKGGRLSFYIILQSG